MLNRPRHARPAPENAATPAWKGKGKGLIPPWSFGDKGKGKGVYNLHINDITIAMHTRKSKKYPNPCSYLALRLFTDAPPPSASLFSKLIFFSFALLKAVAT